ncbi:MAG: hypothetical protein LBK53_02120 [Heliobacteriaceae bacterium]|jgi:hypothetical protein|nr:hypothetical protein [Heliobacteriaceae bacterium]
MILPVRNLNSLSFRANEAENREQQQTKLLKNNIWTRTKISVDKFSNAMSIYPVKGLKGSKNANFYEFLTMGIIPYLTGSAMLITVFNAANRFFPPLNRAKASLLGKKMAAGVVLYGLLKQLSKPLVTLPVKILTGVDAEVPYAKVNYELPDSINDTDITSIEYHKVFESVEFPVWDLLYGNETKGQKRNKYYDKVAKKLGIRTHLKDSDQEVKPRIREIAVKTNTAKNVSSYLWAAVGVGFAFQSTWDKFYSLEGKNYKFWKKEPAYKRTMKALKEAFKESWKSFYNGTPPYKYAGKALLFTAAASSILGVANVLNSAQKTSGLDASNVISASERYVVS